MHLPLLVVGHGVLLQPLRDGRVVDDDCALGHGVDQKVEDVEEFARIAAAVSEQSFRLVELHRALFEHDVVVEGMVHQREKFVLLQRFEHIDLAAREQGADDLKGGVFGGGADEGDVARLHGREQ